MSFDPFFQSLIWSRMACAAAMQELIPFCKRIFPPLPWILGINYFYIHSVGRILKALFSPI
jgi:hypothetical protein